MTIGLHIKGQKADLLCGYNSQCRYLQIIRHASFDLRALPRLGGRASTWRVFPPDKQESEATGIIAEMPIYFSPKSFILIPLARIFLAFLNEAFGKKGQSGNDS